MAPSDLTIAGGGGKEAAEEGTAELINVTNMASLAVVASGMQH